MDNDKTSQPMYSRAMGAPRIPNRAELRQRIPHEHPRILFKPGDFERLKARLEEPSFAQIFQTIKERADAGLGKPLPQFEFPPDYYAPDLGPWDSRYSKTQEGMEANTAVQAPFGAIAPLVESSALVYRLSGDGRYLEQARQSMRALAGLDLTITSYTNTHSFHSVVPVLAAALDYLWDELVAEERDAIVAALAARASEFHPLSVQEAMYRNPLGSHPNVYGPPGMVRAALALFHHQPEAEEWLKDIFTYMDQTFPTFGGEDGGWAQGFGYIHSHNFQTICQIIYVATEVNFFNTPWGCNNGKHLLYFQPPYGNCPNFGDAGYNRPKGLHKSIMQIYAMVHQDPHYQWYADQIEGPAFSGRGAEHALSHLLTWTQTPAPKPPSDLPQAIHLRDIDWVAMHSNLADMERNIMLQFKSNHFGSFSHSHADQNAFLLEAFGQPLLIDSGYYPWYGSPHDYSWTKQTRAHNALLFNGKGQGVMNVAAAGCITAFVTTADFDYTAGDATEAYQQPCLPNHTTGVVPHPELCAVSEGVVRVMRHIVFVRPNAFVILDDTETQAPASVQFLLHALNPFEVDDEQRVVTITNGPALARIHLLDPGEVKISQTDQFSEPPDVGPNKAAQPNQWHLTCDFSPTTSRRLLLSVLVVGRAGEESASALRSPKADLPAVKCIEAPDIIGASIGDTSVQFRLNMDPVAVNCRGFRADGTIKWLQWSGQTVG
jgi:hypothetical protein